MKKFRIGERVIVPWGLDEVEGTVVDMFGASDNPIVTVCVDMGQSDEEGGSSDIGFRADDLRSAPAVAPG